VARVHDGALSAQAVADRSARSRSTFFHGRCEEAIDFDHRALGAEVMALMRFNDLTAERCESPSKERENCRKSSVDICH
jgi:uncharacterized glyoxalase superfamily protein PhnB